MAMTRTLTLLSLVAMLFTSFISCTSSSDKAEENETKAPEGIKGAWHLTWGKMGIGTENEHIRNPENPYQIKVFTDKYFVLIMQNDTGAWNSVFGGEYRLEGDQFIETFLYHDQPTTEEVWLSWNYERRGDSLFMNGPSDMSEYPKSQGWKLNSIDEIRVLAPKGPQGSEEDNEITGAWHLTYGDYTNSEGKTSSRGADGPFQLKIFTPTHFAYIMKNGEGVWKNGSAGTYYLADGKYIETHRYNNNGGTLTASWDFSLAGDTLKMSGPLTATDQNGKDLMNGTYMDEIRVRLE